MKKYFLSIILLLLLPLISCEPRSLIIFDETVYDFGKVKTNTSVKHTFNFKNAGNGVLYIERIKASCSCTGTLLSEKEIPAGGNGKIQIEYHSDENTGNVSRSFYVYTNDPDHGMVKLVIKATVIND